MAKQRITGLTASLMLLPPAEITPVAPSKPAVQTVKVPDETYVRLKTFSGRTRRSHQDILLAALKEYLDRYET